MNEDIYTNDMYDERQSKNKQPVTITVQLELCHEMFESTMVRLRIIN